MYKKAFWTLFIITAIIMAFQIAGYQLLETLIFLIIMDFIALWIYLENRNSLTHIDEDVVKKIENLETACSTILEGISSVSSVINLEEKINKQKEDINFMLEKINEKTLSLEEKLNNFGHNLSSHLNDLRNENQEEKEKNIKNEQF